MPRKPQGVGDGFVGRSPASLRIVASCHRRRVRLTRPLGTVAVVLVCWMKLTNALATKRYSTRFVSGTRKAFGLVGRA
jgi:hypothetical protein